MSQKCNKRGPGLTQGLRVRCFFPVRRSGRQESLCPLDGNGQGDEGGLRVDADMTGGCGSDSGL